MKQRLEGRQASRVLVRKLAGKRLLEIRCGGRSTISKVYFNGMGGCGTDVFRSEKNVFGGLF